MDSDAYFICASPRTGSSLLCGLLGSTRVAGRPESYFRSQDEGMWAGRWGLAVSGGTVDYREFVSRALVAGRTENGVFAARVMWGTLGEVVDRLRGARSVDRTIADLDVLREAFGRLRFIHVQRDDPIAQAVSWARAEQTDVWFETVGGEHAPPTTHPVFDRMQIDDLVTVIHQHNRAWQEWFAAAGVTPHTVRYEDLDRDPIGTAVAALEYLGLEVPHAGALEVRHRRLSDRLNADWIDRYRSGAWLRPYGHHEVSVSVGPEGATTIAAAMRTPGLRDRVIDGAADPP